AAPVLDHGGQDGRHVEDLGCLGEPDDVVHDHCRLMAVQIGKLEGLVVDQDQDRLLGGKEGVEAVLEGKGLVHGGHSGLRLRCSWSGYRLFIGLGLAGNGWYYLQVFVEDRPWKRSQTSNPSSAAQKRAVSRRL